MPSLKLSKSQKVLVYLVDQFVKRRQPLDARKKLMKLMFLIEHYDAEQEKLTATKKLGNKFIIYNYGVFSFDVMEDYISLSRDNILVEEDDTIKTTKGTSVTLDEKTKLCVDRIINIFGNKRAFELECETLEMMNLTKFTKMDVFGQDVRKVIKKNQQLSAS